MRAFVVALALLALSACGGEAPPSKPVATASAAASPKPAAATAGNYSLQDGQLYGYEVAPAAGEAPRPLVMLRYLGERDGAHQLLQRESELDIVIECGRPCEFYKAMAFREGRHLKTERLRLVDRSVAALALEDAWRGRLQRAVAPNDGRPALAWYSEQLGLVLTPVVARSTSSAKPSAK